MLRYFAFSSGVVVQEPAQLFVEIQQRGASMITLDLSIRPDTVTNSSDQLWHLSTSNFIFRRRPLENVTYLGLTVNKYLPATHPYTQRLFDIFSTPIEHT